MGGDIRRPRAHRIRSLDALRGLAALAVVLFHYTVAYYMIAPHTPGLLG
jgi:peptidoglycan/LPS O-acetylase OafA/YrhL